ncbi:MAG: hypothetical protein M0Q51_09720 [Bacteroidales bacterium]|nr:hypothetical protein [Bacteroidales bacterium]
MKIIAIINYLGWASGIFGGLLMLGGVIGFFTGTEFLGVGSFFNFFFIANSFLFLGIFILVGTRCFCCCNCKDDKCCTDEGKAI